MAVKLTGNAVIGQSGGPTVVINQSLAGVVEEARRHKSQIKRLLGARHGTKGILAAQQALQSEGAAGAPAGTEGILARHFVDLLKIPSSRLELAARTPAAALGSVRQKPSQEEGAAILDFCRKNDVRYYFYIGGDDSALSARIIAGLARDAGYEMRLIHIPKTIDNDLMENDHTPGFGSAARFVANAVRGDELDNRSLPGIKVNVVMGRKAGWLTAASVLARRKEGDGPHLIYVPEGPFAMAKFLDDVRQVYARHKRAVICLSEGIRIAPDKFWVEQVAEELHGALKDGQKEFFGKMEPDAFGHLQMSGTGILADYFCARIKEGLKDLGKLRVRGDTFGYLQRSFPGFASKVDAREARQVGRQAVKFACQGKDGSVAIKRKPGKAYRIYLDLVDLDKVAGKTRTLPPQHICPGASDICPSFVDYCRPLVGDLPETWVIEQSN